MKNITGKLTAEGRAERGYTLLEYAAGAALIAIIVGITISAIGNGFQSLGTDIGTWATREGQDLLSSNPNP